MVSRSRGAQIVARVAEVQPHLMLCFVREHAIVRVAVRASRTRNCHSEMVDFLRFNIKHIKVGCMAGMSL